MDRHRRRLSICGAALILLSNVLLLLIGPDAHEFVSIGFMLGTLFGQTTLAAAWAVLGPHALVLRLPLSLIWTVSLFAAVVIHAGMYAFDPVVLIIGVVAFAQWLLILGFFGCLARCYGLCVGNPAQADTTYHPRNLQFGIRQLMVLTGVIGVIFGIGRLALPQLIQVASNTSGSNGEAITFLFLGACAILMSLPLLLAGLLHRYAFLLVAVLLCLIGVGTVWQLPLLKSVGGVGPDAMHLVWINFFTCAWTLVFIGLVRWCGYRLATRASTTEAKLPA